MLMAYIRGMGVVGGVVGTALLLIKKDLRRCYHFTCWPPDEAFKFHSPLLVTSPGLLEQLKELGTWGMVGVVGSTVAAKLSTAAIWGAGFTKTGIAAKSLAAGWASKVGVIKAGSAIAGLQSTASAGGFAFFGPVGVCGGLVALGVYNKWSSIPPTSKDEETEESMQECLPKEEQRNSLLVY